MRSLILVLLVTLPMMVHAQSGQIKGRVLDAASSEPLPFANIFINNTTLGTSADINGEFVISNVPYGTHEVVFSFIGYQSYQTRVILQDGTYVPVVIRLLPVEKQLDNIEIAGTRDKAWEKQMNQFEKIFLGTTPNSLQSKIVNPWVLNFASNNNSMAPLLTASASQPLEINNLALGYHIFFYLKDFKADAQSFSILGNFKFEEMKTTDQKTADRWANARSVAYYGSDRHLFKAILDHRIREEGFQLYTDKSGYEGSTVRSSIFSQEINKSITRFNTENIITPSSRKGVYRIAMKGRIEIHYINQIAQKKVYRDVPHVVGWLETRGGYVDVNENGVPLNTTDIVTSGYINTARVADLLPFDYEPDKAISLLTTKEQSSYKNARYLRMQERVYLHTDKSYYYPGEVLWLKGYLNYRVPDLYDSLSRVLHVELINEQKNILQHIQLPVDSGRVAGQFIFPDSLASGNYYIRAYTRWMLNFPLEEIFIKHIPVLQLSDKVLNKTFKEEPGTNDVIVEITPDKETYQTRDKANIVISVTNHEGNPVISDLSVSVTDSQQSVPLANEMKIQNEYGFHSPPGSDSLLMNHPMEYGISFSGVFTNEKGKPEKATITAIQGKMEDLVSVETDDAGKFRLNGFQFQDTVHFAFQAKNTKGKPYGKFQLDTRAIPSFVFTGEPLSLEIMKTNELQRYPIYQLPPDARLLEEVVVTSAPLDERRTKQGIAYGKPDYVITGDKLSTANSNQNVLVALQGKIPGLQITSYWDGGFQRYIIKIRGGSNILDLAQGKEVFEPVILINGIPFGGGGSTAAEQLEQISAYDVERVEVITRANPLLGVRGTNGAIAVYTKSGSLSTVNSTASIDPSKFQLIPVKGYDVPLDFKMPDYSNEKADHSQPDFRSTIYWEPWFSTDADGKVRFEFFTADLPTHYRVVVEGITAHGETIHKETTIEIKSR